MTLAQKVVAARKAKGLSNRVAAKQLGITPSTLFAIESGATESPNRRVLRSLSDVLGIPARELLGSQK